MKYIKYILIIVIVLGIGYWLYSRNREPAVPVVGQSANQSPKPKVDNLTYNIDGDIFTLKDGNAEKESLPGSPMVDSLSLFGDTAYGDLDGDGDTDAAVWLLNDPGGTGKFHYAALVINDRGTYTPTNALFLGDRIAPQTLEIHNGQAVYNFAERKPSDPFTAEPSVGRSFYVKYDSKTGKISEAK
ncbi:MAG: hypothetical protein V4486_03620 [Patescibacteria group bacterium]